LFLALDPDPDPYIEYTDPQHCSYAYAKHDLLKNLLLGLNKILIPTLETFYEISIDIKKSLALISVSIKKV